MFQRGKKASKELDVRDEIAQAREADYAQLERDAGPIGKAFISAVDMAVHLQSGTIRNYVNWLRRQNPDASPAEIQKMMDAHLIKLVAGTGAGAGAAAAVPGVGLITGGAAVAGESVLFLNAAAFYAVASAYLRGEDVKDKQRRRGLVLMLLMGAKGVAIVDAVLGDDAERVPGRATMAKFSGPTLMEANNILQRIAMRSMSKQMRRAWLGKLLPLGLGAVAGRTANKKLAEKLIDNVQSNLGATPAGFSQPLPEESAGERRLAARMSMSPKDLAAWVIKRFGPKATEDAEDTKE